MNRWPSKSDWRAFEAEANPHNCAAIRIFILNRTSFISEIDYQARRFCSCVDCMAYERSEIAIEKKEVVVR